MVTILQGDATVAQQYTIIAHVVNNQRAWGAGFSGALGARYPDAEIEFRNWKKDRLGSVKYSVVGPNTYVAHMMAQNGLRSATNPIPLQYAALNLCLDNVAQFRVAQRLTVQMPRIGAGLAGGDWTVIYQMIAQHLPEAVIYVQTPQELKECLILQSSLK